MGIRLPACFPRAVTQCVLLCCGGFWHGCFFLLYDLFDWLLSDSHYVFGMEREFQTCSLADKRSPNCIRHAL
jgi:hypothetical protein